MGQTLKPEASVVEVCRDLPLQQRTTNEGFDVIGQLPVELVALVYRHLDAASLGRAACVCKAWQTLASDDAAWRPLVLRTWRHVYPPDTDVPVVPEPIPTWRDMYRIVAKGIQHVNSDEPSVGLAYLQAHNLLDPSHEALARFLLHTKAVTRASAGQLLARSPEALVHFVSLQDFTDLFLPDALRALFDTATIPNPTSSMVAELLDHFATRYHECNPHVLQRDVIYVLCFSLLLLSTDRHSPHVRNKMSKREFVRNNRGWVQDDDFIGHLYDNIFLFGHVARNYS